MYKGDSILNFKPCGVIWVFPFKVSRDVADVAVSGWLFSSHTTGRNDSSFLYCGLTVCMPPYRTQATNSLCTKTLPERPHINNSSKTQ